MSTHAKYAPSDAARWMTCEAALIKFPKVDDADNIYTWEGTNAHILLEKALLDARDATDYVGEQLFPEAPKEFATDARASRLVTQEMADYVQTVVQYIDELYSGYCDEEPELWAEARVAIHKDCDGTLDVGMYWKKARRLEIIDLKYGQGIQVAPDSDQLKIYASGLIQTKKLDGELDNVVLTIAQPRGFHADGPIRSAYFEDFTDYRRDTVAHVVYLNELAKEGTEPDYTPSDAACQWCPGKHICPGRDVQLLEKAMEMFNEEPSNMQEEEGVTPKVLWLCQHADALKDELKYAEQTMLEHVLENGPTLEFKAIAGRANRVWVDDASVIQKKLREWNLPLNKITSPKLLGIPAMEKAIAKNKPKRSNDLQELIFKPQGGPRLVAADNPATPIIRNAESMFEEVDEELDFI